MKKHFYFICSLLYFAVFIKFYPEFSKNSINANAIFFSNDFLHKCTPCRFKATHQIETNSCHKDAILTIGINRLWNLFPFVRTLRTSGSKCRFILFVNSAAMKIYEPNYYESAKNCGVEFNIIDMKEEDITSKQIWYIRFIIYRNYLIQNKCNIDRVIFCDLYDTVVQHDPFIPEFEHGILYLSNEGHLNRKTEDCIQHLKSSFNLFNLSKNQQNELFEKEAYNGGLQGGSTEIMIKFCEIMLKSGNHKTFEIYAVDQGYLNIIVHLGILKKFINYKTLYPNSSIFSTMVRYSISWGWNKRNRRIKFGKISFEGVFPGILHIYDRSIVVKKIIKRICVNDDNITDFIR